MNCKVVTIHIQRSKVIDVSQNCISLQFFNSGSTPVKIADFPLAPGASVNYGQGHPDVRITGRFRIEFAVGGSPSLHLSEMIAA